MAGGLTANEGGGAPRRGIKPLPHRGSRKWARPRPRERHRWPAVKRLRGRARPGRACTDTGSSGPGTSTYRLLPGYLHPLERPQNARRAGGRKPGRAISSRRPKADDHTQGLGFRCSFPRAGHRCSRLQPNPSLQAVAWPATWTVSRTRGPGPARSVSLFSEAPARGPGGQGAAEGNSLADSRPGAPTRRRSGRVDGSRPEVGLDQVPGYVLLALRGATGKSGEKKPSMARSENLRAI